MPTTRPRYSITDTGPVRELLDDAQRRWPEVRDRKELLLQLARVGRESLNLELAAEEAQQRRARQGAALRHLHQMVDVEELLSDRAWQ